MRDKCDGFSERGLRCGALLLCLVAAAFGACDDAVCPVGTMEVNEKCLRVAGSGGDTGSMTSGSAIAGTSDAPADSVPGAGGMQAPSLGGSAGASTASATRSTGGMSAPVSPTAGASGSVSSSAGSPGIAGAGMMSLPPVAGATGTSAAEPCQMAGALRCGSQGVGTREVCAGGFWSAATGCRSGETCVASNADCAPLETACMGSAGEFICDGQGAMLMCNSDGTAVQVTECANMAACQAGLPQQKCPVCMANEYRCTGAILEVCGSDLQGFKTSKDCMSADLCKARQGQCSAAECEAGQYSCDGDNLMQCNESLTGWKLASSCGAGLCDAAAKRCRICTPGQAACEGNSVKTCNAQGQAFSTRACSGSTTHCIGTGRCVQCTSDGDCTGAGSECTESYCDTTAGTCKPRNKPNGQACRTTDNKPGECGAGACKSLCGNQRVDKDEECDIGAASPWIQRGPYDQYSCDEQCRRRYVYTPCATPNQSQASDCGGGYCTVDSSLGSGQAACLPQCSTSGGGCAALSNRQGFCYGGCMMTCGDSSNCPRGVSCVKASETSVLKGMSVCVP